MPVFEDVSKEIQVQTTQNRIDLEDLRSQIKHQTKLEIYVPGIVIKHGTLPHFHGYVEDPRVDLRRVASSRQTVTPFAYKYCI